MSNRKRLSIVEHLIGWCSGKHLFDADDGKKQPSKTRRPEAQLGTCCHCTGRKLQRLNFRLGEGRTDGLKRHFYLRGPFNLPGGKMSILLLPFQYSKHIHYSFSSYKVKTWMLVSRCSQPGPLLFIPIPLKPYRPSAWTLPPRPQRTPSKFQGPTNSLPSTGLPDHPPPPPHKQGPQHYSIHHTHTGLRHAVMSPSINTTVYSLMVLYTFLCFVSFTELQRNVTHMKTTTQPPKPRGVP